MDHPNPQVRSFFSDLETLWAKYPDITFGNLIVQVASQFNSPFSMLAFTSSKFEAWQATLSLILKEEESP